MADKRKHNELSSTSSLDTSQDTSLIEKETKTSTKSQRRKKSKQDKKEKELQLVLSPSNTKTQSEPTTESVSNTYTNTNIDMEQHIAEINKKLSSVLTRDDHTFLKNIVKETILELKDTILSSVINRLEIVEGEIHEKALENTELKNEVEKLTKVIEEKEKETETLKTSLKNNAEKESQRINKVLNDHEQYSRRNNVRITRVPGDHSDEQSLETTYKVLDILNANMDLDLTPQNIDIAHRLGPYKYGRNRNVIVKFVHRQVTHMVLNKRKMLKGKGIAIFEDLTQLNNLVLASTRKKLPDVVERSWYRNGCIFVKSKADGTVKQLEFGDYKGWLDLKWPEDKNTSPADQNTDVTDAME